MLDKSPLNLKHVRKFAAAHLKLHKTTPEDSKNTPTVAKETAAGFENTQTTSKDTLQVFRSLQGTKKSLTGFKKSRTGSKQSLQGSKRSLQGSKRSLTGSKKSLTAARKPLLAFQKPTDCSEPYEGYFNAAGPSCSTTKTTSFISCQSQVGTTTSTPFASTNSFISTSTGARFNNSTTSFTSAPTLPTTSFLPSTSHLTPTSPAKRSTQIGAFFQAAHQERLLHHPYTDVELNKMATNNSSANPETKPLTGIITAKPKIQPQYIVHRDVLTHEVVIKETGYGARDKSIPFGLRQCWQNWSFLSLFTGIIPILQWLPKYSPRRDLFGDIIAGFTVAIMHIPHGMAYGLLAGVGPGSGLYMAIFPVLVYMVLGTSKHISIGTFAVISMMTLKVVQTYATVEETGGAVVNATLSTVLETTTASSIAPADVIRPLEVVTVLAFTVGIVHLAMGFFRLGTLAALLSDPLVNGFTTAAAVHVITSQLKDVLGVSVPRYKGAFKIIYTLIDLGKAVPETNLVTLLFCMSIIVFMLLCNELIKPWLRKRCRFPLPAELIAVIGGTLISDLLSVKENFEVKLVGDIPNRLPDLLLPRFELIPMVAVDSIAIAIVSYSIVMSMGLTFAKKHGYEVRPNQELFALGVGNFVGSCFSCLPLACSLSRSVIQEQTGGATQLAGLVAAALVLMTLLWAGPFFSALPRCVLAGVIIVALKPMFMQAKELRKFAKQGKLELLTWIATFVSVIIIDIDIGLLIGICVSLLTLYIKGLKPYSALLGVIAGAEAIYVDLNHHRNAVELPETKVFRYTGSLNFATSMFFKRALYEALGVDGKKIRRASYVPIQQNGDAKPAAENGNLNAFRCLVLDFSMLGHLDVAGCRAISDIMRELQLLGVRIFLASPTDRVYDTIVHSMALGEGPFEIFPTLHDAVLYASACRTA